MSESSQIPIIKISLGCQFALLCITYIIGVEKLALLILFGIFLLIVCQIAYRASFLFHPKLASLIKKLSIIGSVMVLSPVVYIFYGIFFFW